MAVLFDAAMFAIHERASAYEAALNTTIQPSNVQLDTGGSTITARIEAWELGVGITVVQARTTGQTIVRTPAQIRRADSDDMSIGMILQGTGTAHQGSRIYQGARTINPMLGMEPFKLRFATQDSRPNVSACARVDLGRLGLPMDVINSALHHLPSSPLYSYFLDHLARLPTAASSVEGTPAAVMLGSATTELARALMASASTEGPLAKDGLASVLTHRIDSYIHQNHSDHSLTAEKIAAEHNISLRHLYALFGRRGRSVEQQIIRERLEHARILLSHPQGGGRSIEAIARACGFSHPQHLSRRFRQEFGMSPREWRSMNNAVES